MGEVYAVLDTCILLPSPLYNTMLYIAHYGVFNPIWTDRILEELQRNLARWKTPEQAANRLLHMRAAFEPQANLDRQGIAYHALIDAMPNHEQDRHVLAAAVALEPISS